MAMLLLKTKKGEQLLYIHGYNRCFAPLLLKQNRPLLKDLFNDDDLDYSNSQLVMYGCFLIYPKPTLRFCPHFDTND